jgi:DNA-binding MarR family transcriptional regulator
MNDDIHRSILSRFHLVNRALRRQAENMKEMSDLTLLQMQALFFVKHHSKPMMRDLAEELKMSPSSASLLADRLIAAGWLERINDEEDRRVIYLTFSKHAEKRMDAIHQRAVEHMGQLLDKMESQDLQDLNRILGAMESILTSSK